MKRTPFAMNSFRGKQVLALVRDGDFAHAGEEEAIAMTMDAIPRDQDRHLLDAGCGRGGTAAYLHSHGWGQVTGADIDAPSIAEAQASYPGLNFINCDIRDVGQHVDNKFEVITLFNVLYAVPDQQNALRALACVAAASAVLAIFEYVNIGGYPVDALIDAGGPFLPHPPSASELKAMLAASGWEITSFRGVNDEYARWYVALVDKIKAKRAGIESLAGLDGYRHVHSLYSGLLNAIQGNQLGGAIVHARR